MKNFEENEFFKYTGQAIKIFNITGHPIRERLIESLLEIKLAVAMTNGKLGYLPTDKAEAIISSTQLILKDLKNYSKFFQIDALSGGAGTSFNMNVNEVICFVAKKELEVTVDPLDDVNLHQSTNDVFPTAIKITVLKLLKVLEKNIRLLLREMHTKEELWRDIVVSGRTQLQPAVPLTLGKKFSAFAEPLSRDRWRVFKSRERIKTLNIGGMAIGTGATTPKRFIFEVIDQLRNLTELNITRGENVVDNTQNMDVFVEISGIMKANATTLMKIANDIRLLSSSEFGEFRIPENQIGSSIMPNKINPVISESVIQGGLKVIANDMLISQIASRGELELNVFTPLLAEAVVENLEILINLNRNFAEFCIKNLSIQESQIAKNLKDNKSLITFFVPKIGYKKAKEIFRKAEEQGKPIEELLIEESLVTLEEVEDLLKPSNIVSLGYKD